MAQRSELPPVDRREEVRVDQEPGYVRKQRVIRDAGSERRQTINRVNQLIWVIFGIIIALIAFRVVLRLIVANPANTFADFIYGVTDLFLRPFYGLVGTPTTTNGMALEISSLIAIVVYAIVAALIVTVINILFNKSRARRVETYERE
ncbi:MAG: YggT family protein [Chloroflexota bacterium]